jgi:hypothetical protein
VIIRFDANAVALDEADVFSALAVILAGGTTLEEAAVLVGGRAEGDHLWIPGERLRALGRSDDEAWSASFDAMVEKVKPYGYVDEASGDIRVHVEE